MSEEISPQPVDGAARRIEVIRQTASHGDPYEIRFTRYAAQRQRERRHCGRSMDHPAHLWALGRQVAQCPGTAAAPDRSDGNGQ